MKKIFILIFFMLSYLGAIKTILAVFLLSFSKSFICSYKFDSLCAILSAGNEWK